MALNYLNPGQDLAKKRLFAKSRRCFLSNSADVLVIDVLCVELDLGHPPLTKHWYKEVMMIL
jgi:hypothetical protein